MLDPVLLVSKALVELLYNELQPHAHPLEHVSVDVSRGLPLFARVVGQCREDERVKVRPHTAELAP